MTHVAMTAFSRPEYLTQTLDSWSAVRGDWDLHLAVDPHQTQDLNVSQAARHGHDVAVNPHRHGVLSNVWYNLDRAFQDHEFVVVAEDDVLVAEDIIEMFDWANHEYADDPEILLVNGAQLWWGLEEDSQNHVVRRVKRFSATSWATWRDRWEGTLRDDWDHDYSKNGWDWWVGRELIRGGPWWTIAPSRSRSQHIGVRGAHMRPHMYHESQSKTFVSDPDPGRWEED